MEVLVSFSNTVLFILCPNPIRSGFSGVLKNLYPKSIFFKGYFPYLPTNTQIRRSLEQINTVHFLIWLVFEAIPGKFWEQNTQPNTAYRKDFHGKLVPPARSPPFSRSLSSDRGQSRTVPRLPICLKS